MKTETAPTTNLKKRLTILTLIVTTLLLIPLVAMQFTKEVNWNGIDFLAAAILLFTAGFGIEIATRLIQSTQWKIIVTVIFLLALFLIWAELAVGIFGSPLAGS